MMKQAERDNDMSIRLVHDYYLKVLKWPWQQYPSIPWWLADTAEFTTVKNDNDNSTRLSHDDWQIQQNIQQLKMTMTTVPVYPMMTGRYSRIYNS